MCAQNLTKTISISSSEPRAVSRHPPPRRARSYVDGIDFERGSPADGTSRARAAGPTGAQGAGDLPSFKPSRLASGPTVLVCYEVTYS